MSYFKMQHSTIERSTLEDLVWTARRIREESHEAGDKDIWACDVYHVGQWVQRFPFLRWELALAEAIAYRNLFPDYPVRLRHMATGDIIPMEILG